MNARTLARSFTPARSRPRSPRRRSTAARRRSHPPTFSGGEPAGQRQLPLPRQAATSAQSSVLPVPPSAPSTCASTSRYVAGHRLACATSAAARHAHGLVRVRQQRRQRPRRLVRRAAEGTPRPRSAGARASRGPPGRPRPRRRASAPPHCARDLARARSSRPGAGSTERGSPRSRRARVDAGDASADRRDSADLDVRDVLTATARS